MDDGDPSLASRHDRASGSSASHRGVVDVAMDGGEVTEGLELAQHRHRHEIAGMDDEVGRPQPLDAGAGSRRRPRGKWVSEMIAISTQPGTRLV